MQPYLPSPSIIVDSINTRSSSSVERKERHDQLPAVAGLKVNGGRGDEAEERRYQQSATGQIPQCEIGSSSTW
jgi:hypothetical protein